jgi:hypothetical protein
LRLLEICATKVQVDSTAVLFPRLAARFYFVVEQFWGRAAKKRLTTLNGDVRRFFLLL